MAKVSWVCTRCGYMGKPRKEIKGSFFVELILWLCGILPGVIYTIYRLSTKAKVCDKCGNMALIPADSPVGLQMLSEQARRRQAAAVDPVDAWERAQGG